MEVLARLLNSFVFWSAWIIIPIVVEIIPAIGSVVTLLKRRRKQGIESLPDPALWPELSVIIPVYNSADTLEACIRSLDASTYPSSQLRLFVTNNGSGDESFAVFGRCQAAFPNLRMQWMDAKQGKSKALNMALYQSSGKYIVNLDSDGTLEPNALCNMIRRFEANPQLNCATGSILTDPKLIAQYKRPLSKLLRKLEFVEYAQAFLAGRSYASESDSIYTLSGAFSAFRKNAILDSWLYDTSTLAEDTHLTFQMRYVFGQQIEICEDALFIVDPIESFDKLYAQRQRWQRGELEVAHLFPQSNMRLTKMFSDVNVRTVLFDHTFAFPRMVWYVALLCLMALNVSAEIIIFSVLLIFALYILVGYLYYGCSLVFLRMTPDLQAYYRKQWWVVILMPFYNLVLFFVRFAGIINSIGTRAKWSRRTLSQEGDAFRKTTVEQAQAVAAPLKKARTWANETEERLKRNADAPKRIGWYVGTIALFTIAALILSITLWLVSVFGVGLEEIIQTITGPLDGTSNDTAISGLAFCLPIVLGVLAFTIGLCFLDRKRQKRKGRNKALSNIERVLYRCISYGSILAVVMSIGFACLSFDVGNYLVDKSSKSRIYEQHYVDPNAVSISDGDQKRNLLYIYMESMESTYASFAEGGNQDVNYIQNLTNIAKRNYHFSNSANIGGSHSMSGTGLTVAALFATTTGVPYQFPLRVNMNEVGSFASGITGLGDVLASKGYKQEFICGSNGDFSARKLYFQQHGNYDVVDLFEAQNRGYLRKGYFDGWWGFEDHRLYDIAKSELDKISSQGDPFNMTILTVDTHHVQGHVCERCGSDYSVKTANVVSCADKQIKEFLDWCAQQPWYENTTIVITGDHPRMDNSLVEGKSYYDRTVFDCFINPAKQTSYTNNREFSSMDIFPTVISSLGFTIEGDRLGLGVDLFSGKKTLMEQFGYEWLSAEVSKGSDYYLSKFAPELIGASSTTSETTDDGDNA